MCALSVRRSVCAYVCVPAYSVCVHKAGDCIAALRHHRTDETGSQADYILCFSHYFCLSPSLCMCAIPGCAAKRSICVCVKAENEVWCEPQSLTLNIFVWSSTIDLEKKKNLRRRIFFFPFCFFPSFVKYHVTAPAEASVLIRVYAGGSEVWRAATGKTSRLYTPERWRHHQVGGGRLSGPERKAGERVGGRVLRLCRRLCRQADGRPAELPHGLNFCWGRIMAALALLSSSLTWKGHREAGKC